ncbi:MAG: hypothetical protein M1835_001706 [Candelina submexicana]|nr:MAG: hypothetical protein M1835_001706 [Candelina submexicana]
MDATDPFQIGFHYVDPLDASAADLNEVGDIEDEKRSAMGGSSRSCSAKKELEVES